MRGRWPIPATGQCSTTERSTSLTGDSQAVLRSILKARCKAHTVILIPFAGHSGKCRTTTGNRSVVSRGQGQGGFDPKEPGEDALWDRPRIFMGL